jgi:murein DD-endopeptidase MepM/ murein hydrolase activator NlpD
MINRSANWRRALCLAVSAALLTSLVLPAGAQGLRSRLSHLFGRKQEIQAQIRVIRKTQASATTRLWQAQAELSQVQARLHSARGQLVVTQHDLAVSQANLARLEKRTAQHKQDVQAHVLALYESGTNSYLDVVLQADSFNDFANREQVVKALANQDQYMLTHLVTLDDQVTAERDGLAAKEQQRQQLVSQIASDEAVTQRKTAEVHQILAAANAQRSAAEEELAAEASEENSVLAMMRARAHGNYQGSYHGSYGGSWSGSLLRPVNGPVTSPFGMRIHPITHRWSMHEGVDLGDPTGTPIHAAANGLVIHTGWERAYGQAVIIDNGGGVQTWYCHCSQILCSEGQLVKRGQVIALVGMTGWATGPHLHFGVMKDGNWVNPVNFMQ